MGQLLPSPRLNGQILGFNPKLLDMIPIFFCFTFVLLHYSCTSSTSLRIKSVCGVRSLGFTGLLFQPYAGHGIWICMSK